MPIPINTILVDTNRMMSKGYPIDIEIWEEIKVNQIEILKQNNNKIVNKKQVQISPDKIKNVIEKYCKRRCNSFYDTGAGHINNLAYSLQIILQHRMEELKNSTNKYQEELKKTDCHLKLPDITEFDTALPQPDFLSNTEIEKDKIFSFNIENKNILGSLNILELICRFFSEEKTKQDVKVIYNESDVNTHLESQYRSFREWFESSAVHTAYIDTITKLSDNIEKLQQNIISEFQKINTMCNANVKIFKKTIDNRQEYEQKLENLQQLKNIIEQINNASFDFQNTWKSICTEQD